MHTTQKNYSPQHQASPEISHTCARTHGLWTIRMASQHPKGRAFVLLNFVSKHLVLSGVHQILKNICLVNETWTKAKWGHDGPHFAWGEKFQTYHDGKLSDPLREKEKKKATLGIVLLLLLLYLLREIWVNESTNAHVPQGEKERGWPFAEKGQEVLTASKNSWLDSPCNRTHGEVRLQKGPPTPATPDKARALEDRNVDMDEMTPHH